MKKKLQVECRRASLWLVLFLLALSGPIAVFAQEAVAVEPVVPDTVAALESAEAVEQPAEPEVSTLQSETVTINVKDANIAEVLKAYSLQTGQSIVVGPDVVSDNVNVRLNNTYWQEALDVILKPYGFGYRQVGETIVISKLENIVQVEGIEPLASKVFKLRYLDAYDVKEVCEAQLTSRGKITILSNKGLPGWEFGGGSSSGQNSSRSGSTLGSSERREVEPIEKSKTIIVTDVPSSLTAIGGILEELDQEPKQVLIESRFIEVSTGALLDFGVDMATGINDPLTRPGVEAAPQTGNNLWGVAQNDSATLIPGAFDPIAESLSGAIPYNSGLQVLFQSIGGENLDLMLHALEEDGSANVLSAPQILTLDNQEAAILVGTKFPIIESDSTGGSTGSANVSTSLDYYENVGIQLNVIPQISNDEYINMIVHPAVSSIDGFESGVVSTGTGASGALTRYPVLKVREAQTQILLKSGDSAVIGGLQSERDRESIHQVPLLGDIPYLGVLFRRTTTNKEKIELLIFIKASIVENETYAAESAVLKDEWEGRIGLNAEEETEAAAEESEAEETAVATETVVAEEDAAVTAEADTDDEDKEAIIALVNGEVQEVEEAETEEEVVAEEM